MVRSRSALALAALVLGAALAGCKYSNTPPPLTLPCPATAPTLAPGIVTEYGVPTSAAKPYGIAVGPDGNLWFTEATGNKVARITTSGSITEYPLPSGAAPLDIAAGPSGNQAMWFVEAGTSQIGTISTTSGIITQFALPAKTVPSGMAADHSGNLWFAEFNANAIAKITVSGSITPYVDNSFPGGQPNSVAVAPDGSVWFVDDGTSAVGHLTVVSGNPSFTEYALSGGSTPVYLAFGSDGNLWVTEAVSGAIAKVIPSTGAVTEFAVPTQANFCLVDGALPFGIALDPSDGDIWFAEADAGQVGRITPGGVVTEYGIPGNGTTAVNLAWGPDGNLWFTDAGVDPNVTIGADSVGKINVGGIPALRVGQQKAQVLRHYTWRKLPLGQFGNPKTMFLNR